MKKTIRSARAVVLAGALSMLLVTGAGGGTRDYGPAPVTHPSAPGGFSRIAASATCGPDGCTISGRVGRAEVRVVVAPGTLRIPLQVTLRAPSLVRLRQHLTSAGTEGTLRSAVAVSAAKLDGAPIDGRLSGDLLRLTIRATRIGSGDRVLHWSPRQDRFVPVTPARVVASRGAVTVRFNRGEELVVLGPAQSH